MATFDFQTVLVWTTNPGGAVRLLRNGAVTVYNASTDAVLFNLTSDSAGLVSFTTTDVATVYLKTTGWTSEHITAASAVEAAAAAGVSNDAGIKTAISNPASQSGSYLNATFARSSGLPVDASGAAGVDPTGAADSTTALQAVLDANAATDFQPSKVVRLKGTFTIGSTLFVKGHVDASAATLNYTGSGVAVQIGSSALGNVGRWNVALGDIICTTKPAGASWVAGSVGLKLTNVVRSRISYGSIKGFETGLLMVGDGSYGSGGVAYNTFMCGSLDNNLVNQKLALVAGGTTPYVNENVYVGGSWMHSDGTYPQAGMRHIQIGDAGGSLNNNRWIGCSLEGGREEYILDVYGNDNLWVGCRWEFTGVSAPVRWRATAARNLIIGGYASTDIAPTIDSGAVANNVISANQMKFDVVGDGGFIGSSAAGGTNSVFTVMGVDWQRLGQTVGANYMTKILGGTIKLKTTTDAADRILLDYSSRWIKIGTGGSAPVRGLVWANASPEGSIVASTGSIYVDCTSTTGGLYAKATGTANTGWQRIGFAPSTTALRPTAASVGVGGTYYDTTLSKPIWSDGTVWRDATGTAV